MTVYCFWCSVSKRLVGTFRVVELEVVGEPGVRLGDGAVRFQVDILILHGSPQSLGEDIVHTASSAIHANLYFFVQEWLEKLVRGKVRSLIRVADLWHRDGKRAVERRKTAGDFQARRYFPADDVPTEPIDDCHEICPAGFQFEVGDVGAPDLIGANDWQPF